MKVNTVGPSNAKIMLVGEAPGENEDREGLPFSNNGNAGKTLNWLLSQAGINRAECLVTNVARMRPPGNRMDFFFQDKECTMPKPELAAWVEELRQDIIEYRPNIVIGLGAYALWALIGDKRIGRFRGYTMQASLVPGQKILCTYHPANISREWRNHFPAIMDLRKAKWHSQSPQMPADSRIILSDASQKRMVEYCKEVLANKEWNRVCVDVETVQPGSHISIIGLAHSPKFGISTWILRNKMPCAPENDEYELWYWIARVLEEKEVIIQNASYDACVALVNHGIHIKNLWMDTLIAAHAVWPELPRDLGFLASLCLDVPPWKHMSNEQPSFYNACDAANTFGVALVLERKIKEYKVEETYNFEMRQLPVAMMLQLQGTLINPETQARLSADNGKVIKETGDKLESIFGRRINFKSTPQKAELFYKELGLPVQYKRRKNKNEPRKVTTDKDAIKKLASLAPENQNFKIILDHIQARTNQNFIDVEVSPEGKVHTSYNITGKKIDTKDEDDEGRKSFGRWSSSESIVLPYGSGNLQNIPEIAREMYVPPPGKRIVTADYIQAEAVVVAYLSGDRRLVSIFKESFGKTTSERKKHKEWDVHILKASDLFGVKIADVTPAMRKVGKTIRHARNYSAGPGVVSTRLGCTMAEAKALLLKDDLANPLLKLWQESIVAELKQSRVLYNLFGRAHRFLDRWGDSLCRSAYSYKPQSTVGDLMNRSLVRIYEDDNIKDLIDIWLQLHDAGYFLTDDNDDAMFEAMYWIRKHMIEPIRVSGDVMLIDIDFKWGYNWKDLHEVDYPFGTFGPDKLAA